MSWKIWFRKHDRFLSAIGTLVVLLTFMTKEQLRERWKDLAEALETAQYQSRLHEQLSSIAVKINDLPNQAEDAAASDDLMKHMGRGGLALRAYGMSSFFAEGADDLEEKFSPLLPLLDKLKGHEAAKRNVETSLKHLVLLRQLSHLMRKIYERARVEEAAEQDRRETPEFSELRREISEAIGKANLLVQDSSEVQRIRDEILTAADAQVTWDRKAATYANSISVVLYSFGVILSLGGKLAGEGAEDTALVPVVE